MVSLPTRTYQRASTMCLAIPGKIIMLHGNARATVDIGGLHKEISVALIDTIQKDDYVIVHVGFAIGKLSPEEAFETLSVHEAFQKTEPADA